MQYIYQPTTKTITGASLVLHVPCRSASSASQPLQQTLRIKFVLFSSPDHIPLLYYKIYQVSKFWCKLNTLVTGQPYTICKCETTLVPYYLCTCRGHAYLVPSQPLRDFIRNFRVGHNRWHTTDLCLPKWIQNLVRTQTVLHETAIYASQLCTTNNVSRPLL